MVTLFYAFIGSLTMLLNMVVKTFFRGFIISGYKGGIYELKRLLTSIFLPRTNSDLLFNIVFYLFFIGGGTLLNYYWQKQYGFLTFFYEIHPIFGFIAFFLPTIIYSCTTWKHIEYHRNRHREHNE